MPDAASPKQSTCSSSRPSLLIDKRKMTIFRKKTMSIIIWLLTGLAAGAVAKRITPQQEKPGWVSSLVVGLIGAMLGGFVFGLVGIKATSMLGSFLFAVVGSVLFLFIYHRYLADKIDLGI